MDLNDKVVVITGGLGLLGRKFVESVLLQKATVIIADINNEEGTKAIVELNNTINDAKIDFLYMDITNKEVINDFIKNIHNKYGKIDALVNNAYPRNKNYGRKFEDVEYCDFCDNVNLHLGGYFLTSQCFAEYFKTQNSGNIINISSIYGVIAPRFEIYEGTSMTMPVEYAAIKSALIHLTKYMSKYYKGHNIRFNTLSLGGIEDGQPETFIKKYNINRLNKGMLDANDIVGTLIFLLSDLSQFINGQNLIVDDGWTL